MFVLLLPVLPCRHSLTIPHKRSFYGYAAYILLIHLIDTLGAALMVGGSASGICFINLGSYLYFTTFAPVVYFTFLQGFFRVAQPTLLFSYKSQVRLRLSISTQNLALIRAPFISARSTSSKMMWYHKAALSSSRTPSRITRQSC